MDDGIDRRIDEYTTARTERRKHMILTLNENTNIRLQHWSKANNLPPEVLIHDSLNEALDDWEDYMDALRICAEVDAGSMQVLPFSEVEKQLDELNALEN